LSRADLSAAAAKANSVRIRDIHIGRNEGLVWVSVAIRSPLAMKILSTKQTKKGSHVTAAPLIDLNYVLNNILMRPVTTHRLSPVA